MRVVTTASRKGYQQHGQRWLDSRSNWPEGTEFVWYTEGYSVDGIRTKDFVDLPEFTEWKLKHASYIAPGWQWNVVGYAHKVFAAIDALYDYDGVGVWLDSDCVTYKPIPAGLLEERVKDAFMAVYKRKGLYTETGLWIMDCSHPQKRAFLDHWRNIYLAERYKGLSQWHDCTTLDATVREFMELVEVASLSDGHEGDFHPQAKSELGKYIDHCKGGRKLKGASPENKFRKAA